MIRNALIALVILSWFLLGVFAVVVEYDRANCPASSRECYACKYRMPS